MSNRTKGLWRISAVLTGLSLVLPFIVLCLIAPVNPDALLPACCRRHGEHHCMMRMMEGGGAGVVASSSAPQLGRIYERCPYMPGAVAGVHVLAHPGAESIAFSVVLSGGTIRVSLCCDREAAQDTANFKRGPPFFQISA